MRIRKSVIEGLIKELTYLMKGGWSLESIVNFDKFNAEVLAVVCLYADPEIGAAIFSGVRQYKRSEILLTLNEFLNKKAPIIRDVSQSDANFVYKLRRLLNINKKRLSIYPVDVNLALANILKKSSKRMTKNIINDMYKLDAKQADEVRDHLFIFNDIARMDRESIQLLLENVNAKQLFIALDNSPKNIRNPVIEQIRQIYNPSLKEIEEAKKSVYGSMQYIDYDDINFFNK